MIDKTLSLAADLFGCPNRCRHCWLGHMPNIKMDDNADIWLIEYFKPFFSKIKFYSWLREPDFCGDYRQRWQRDQQISVGTSPERFELASFWRIVRDPQYAPFLKSVGVKKVQLTFFGLEDLTDKFTGRKGAFRELLNAAEILIENQIAPRWQAFINEENIDEIVQLRDLTVDLRLDKRCRDFGGEFKFFVHAGSCDGENRKLYPIRIQKNHIPDTLIPCYLNYQNVMSEQECCQSLAGDSSHVVYHNGDLIVLNISNQFDAFFNFTHMTDNWKIGNLKTDHQADIIRRIVEEDIPALRLAKSVTVGELVRKYGDFQSKRAFLIGDYKEYLLNRLIDDALN